MVKTTNQFLDLREMKLGTYSTVPLLQCRLVFRLSGKSFLSSSSLWQASVRGVLGVRFHAVVINLGVVREARESSLNLLARVVNVACSKRCHSYLCLLVPRRMSDPVLVRHGMPLLVAAVLEFEKLSYAAGNLGICCDRERCFMVKAFPRHLSRCSWISYFASMVL
ncbi:hypothetical protein Dimus_022854 [Dionaea muscipula]